MTTAALNACRARIESLESSLRVYRQACELATDDRYHAAFNRVSTQLDGAYLDLNRIEAELLTKKGLLR